MKIVFIVPGSGGTFYCENCLRDAALVQAFRRQGHDVTMVPIYLPFFTDEPDAARETPVFFGGINVFLQEKLPFYRHAPRWLTRVFDSRRLLQLATKRSSSTQPLGMGKMTLSMLQGTEGHHVAELSRMVEWLEREGRPDVIQISTALLLGLAHQLREKLGSRIVCLVQDEDTWVDELDKPYDALCWEAIQRTSADADVLVAASQQYADVFAQRAGLPRGRLKVVYPGIDVQGYAGWTDERQRRPPCVGYLSKMTESMGLGTLVEAYVLLKAKPAFRNLRLRAMGGATGDDPKFLAGLRRRLAAKGMVADVEFLPEMDRTSRIAFLQSLSALSVPVPRGVAFGAFLLESMAAGVPVVQPNAGAFAELVEATGGGVIYEPNTAEGLAEALAKVLGEPGKAMELGRRGRAAVLERFTVERMATKMIEVYRA